MSDILSTCSEIFWVERDCLEREKLTSWRRRLDPCRPRRVQVEHPEACPQQSLEVLGGHSLVHTKLDGAFHRVRNVGVGVEIFEQRLFMPSVLDMPG